MFLKTFWCYNIVVTILELEESAKMTCKMIVSDFDNTLCDKKKNVSERTKNAMRKFVDGGGKFVICTTRPYAGIAPYAKNLGLKAEVITNQGAIIHDLQTGEILNSKCLSSDELKDILRFLKLKSNHIYFADTSQLIVSHMGKIEKLLKRNVNCPISKTRDFFKQEVLQMEVAQVIVGSYNPKYIEYLKRISRKHFQDKFEIGLCDKYLLNYTKKGVSKGSAIETLAQKYGIEKNEIVSFGDSENDKSMFDFSGIGVAMSNGNRELKKRADFVCQSVDDDGLAKFVEKEILQI